jgi:hypothetical protein
LLAFLFTGIPAVKVDSFLMMQAFLLLQAPFYGVALPVVGSRPLLPSLF